MIKIIEEKEPDLKYRSIDRYKKREREKERERG